MRFRETRSFFVWQGTREFSSGGWTLQSCPRKKKPSNAVQTEKFSVSKSLVAACMLLLGGILTGAPLQAACPAGASTLYLSTPANSQPDKLYGLLPEPWRDTLHEPLLTVSLPGRGGSYAASKLLDAQGDGCSVAAVILPSLFLLSETANSMYAADDISVAAVLAGAPVALWVAEESPFRSLAELVLFARAKNETPGNAFTVAGTGRYTDQHLATLIFDRTAGIESFYLPVLGSAEAGEAVKAGKAYACWGYALPRETMPGLRALGVAGERRSPALPDVPTFREVQLEMVAVSHFALAVRSSTPKETLLQVRDAVAQLLANQVLRGRMAAGGFLPLALGARDVDAFLEGRKQAAKQALADYLLIPRQLRR